MSTSVLEIIDYGDGEIVLQRSGDDSEPLLSICFSEESRLYLMDNRLDVARVMIQAGLQAAANLKEQDDTPESSRPAAEQRILH